MTAATKKPEALSRLLRRLEACDEAREWAENYGDLQSAWDACERADWMCWLLVHLHRNPPAAHSVRLVLCACAETALKYVPTGENRPANAIRVARLYAIGRAPDEERAAARAAAWDAAGDAAGAAAGAAARAAAWDAAGAAARAAAWDAAGAAAGDAAGDAAGAAAWDAALKEMSVIVRGMIPDPMNPPAAETLWSEP